MFLLLFSNVFVDMFNVFSDFSIVCVDCSIGFIDFPMIILVFQNVS